MNPVLMYALPIAMAYGRKRPKFVKKDATARMKKRRAAEAKGRKAARRKK